MQVEVHPYEAGTEIAIIDHGKRTIINKLSRRVSDIVYVYLVYLDPAGL